MSDWSSASPASTPASPSTGAFAYQKRLLERTSSLARAPSQTQAKGLLATTSTRRFTHKPAASVDSIRGARDTSRYDADASLAGPSSQPSPPLGLANTPPVSRRWNSPDLSPAQIFPPNGRTSPPPESPFPSIRRNTVSNSPAPASTWAEDCYISSGVDSPLPAPQQISSPVRTSPVRSPLLPAYNPPTDSLGPTSLRRHTSTKSIDSVRGKWEERAKEAESDILPQSTGGSQRGWGSNIAPVPRSTRVASPERMLLSKPPLVSDYSSSREEQVAPTPTYLKRRTLPNPVSPSEIRGQWENRTRANGPDVRMSPSRTLNDDFARSPRWNPSPEHEPRSRTPTTPTPPSPLKDSYPVDRFPSVSKRHTLPTHYTPPSPISTDEATTPTSPSFAAPSPAPIHLPTGTSLQSSSVSLVKSLGGFTVETTTPFEGSSSPPLRVRTRSVDSSTSTPTRLSSAPSPIPSSSTSDPMNPAPYRSSYMKKRGAYGSALGSRKLGQHLPRIASGDGNEDWEEGESSSIRTRRADRIANRERVIPVPTTQTSPTRQELVIPAVTNAEEVQGMPRRLRLSKQTATASSLSPLPSARLLGGSWADTQRHLLLAYEYLCHVGEAQQWIEGCLDEELGFGVVEMEEGLRNGVVLAKLARIWEGEAVVRRIFEHPKLQYRHSDNINYFFAFIRRVGLPEGFIFELTDLYEKKNLPKVIYCLHALSYLLSRRGMAQRIGNLVGRLKFSDDQLQQTQKGLNDAGVSMPNFKSVSRELAKEINEEPEEEIETDDERRDRLLLENVSSIIQVQSFARGLLARRALATHRVRVRLVERSVGKLQARCRGRLVRQHVEEMRSSQANLEPWVIALQASIRGLIIRRVWAQQVARAHSAQRLFVKIQAQARGVIERRKHAKLKNALRSSKFSVVRLQSLARAKISRRTHTEAVKKLEQPVIQDGVIALQSYARGIIQRRQIDKSLHALERVEPFVIGLQGHARAALVRRRIRNQLAKLDDAEDIVVQIQASCRALLARRELLSLIQGLRHATPVVRGLQAHARAILARRTHASVNKALANVHVAKSVGGFQALARAAIARNRVREQVVQFGFVEPDVVGIQAACRGALLRYDYYAWRDHLHSSQDEAIHLQSLLRGILERRRFQAKMQYFRSNLDKVVKIQSLFRAKEQREQYRQLTMGTNVNVGTIKNFVHLLDDSEADFEQEIKVERLRKRVVEHIRENQALETEVNELDVKIALVVQNVKSFEELIKARRLGNDSAALHASRASVLEAFGDPFAGNTLDQRTKRRLELYQQLFYLLQTKSEYFARLFFHLSRAEGPEKTKRMTERVVLTIFGYGQDRREDFLLLKLFQLAIDSEIQAASSLLDVTCTVPLYMTVAVHYIRPRQVAYVRDALQVVIKDVIEQEDLDLETDPVVIYRARINDEEMRSGRLSSKPKDVSFHTAVVDPETRTVFIQALQKLQVLTSVFVKAITTSTKKMPYGMRCIARETLLSLKAKFPNQPQEVYAAAMGKLVYYRYLNPAIVTPETFDMIPNTLGPIPRKNLAEISKMLTQISTGELFGDDNPCLQPLNSFVAEAITTFSEWFTEVADVPDAEAHFHAHEFLDATVQPKPIYISPNEVYAMHSLLSQNLDDVAPARDDTLRTILSELDGVPHLGSAELKDARDRAITLDLTNRFADVRDPQANEKALWVQAKRGVLAVLRVQPAADLVESLIEPVTEEHEILWEEIVENELIHDHIQDEHQRRMPSTGGADSAYRLEDIRSLPYAEVKARALFFLLELEKLGRVTRSDGYQGVLNAIAGDVRSKHRKRIQRKHEMDTMNEALAHLEDRKKTYEEQIQSYHSYIDSAMSTMQRGKGKKRFVMPFTKQFFHMRDLSRSGKTPQFGSFIYRAQDLYDKGILLSIDQFSPRQFDRIDLVIESNEVGVFIIKVTNTANGVAREVASQELRMEDLLQEKFENHVSLSLFDGMAKVNLNLLLYQINKKFYV